MVDTTTPQTASLRRLVPQRRPDAFQILLAHHPHAFDPAAAVGIPLTLAGHTHGGQLMLNERLGAGPAIYRYWSGLYRKPDGNALVVSNAGRAALMAILAWIVLSDAVQLWHLYILAGALGLLDAFHYPASLSVVPSLVEKRKLEAANARSAREIIPSDLWEQVNTFYRKVEDASQDHLVAAEPHGFLEMVIKESNEFIGRTLTTMRSLGADAIRVSVLWRVVAQDADLTNAEIDKLDSEAKKKRARKQRMRVKPSDPRT